MCPQAHQLLDLVTGDMSISARIVGSVERGPDILTAHAAFSTLDEGLGSLELSGRAAPLQNSQGLVRLLLHNVHWRRFWYGSVSCPKHSESEPRGQKRSYAEHMDDGELKTERKESSEDSSAEDKLDPASEILAKLWDTVEKSTEAKSSGKEAISSSSSSRSSSSSSTSSSDKSKKSIKKDVSHDIKRQADHVIQFGIHHLVKRVSKTGEITGYQLSCCNAAHHRCTKELSASVVGNSLQDCRRVLKAWSLMGHSMASRQEHMDPNHKATLLDALQRRSLLQESELDELAVASTQDTVTAPFRNIEWSQPPSGQREGQQERALLGEKRQQSSSRSTCSYAGSCSRGCPARHHLGNEVAKWSFCRRSLCGAREVARGTALRLSAPKFSSP